LYKVILVDDEPWVLLGIKSTFKWEEYGFEVDIESTDSMEALDLIVQRKPDAVFMDVRMPRISGIELTRILREKNVKSKIIIISGYAEFSYAQEAIKYGVFEYCLKPIKQTDADRVLKNLKTELDALKTGEKTEEEYTDNYQNVNNIKFKKMLAFIHENYQKRLFLNELAENFQLNANYCCFLFKKNFDCNFSEYLTRIRMKMAGELLMRPELSINKVAEMTGYDDYYYFNRVFKKHYGVAPNKYRNMKG